MCFAILSSAQFLSDHFQFHCVIYKSWTYGQENGYKLLLVPLVKKKKKKAKRETTLITN